MALLGVSLSCVISVWHGGRKSVLKCDYSLLGVWSKLMLGTRLGMKCKH